MTTLNRPALGAQPAVGARRAPATARDERPLLRLLRYAGGHRRYAALTIGFGVAGFLLSFVYPWIIGSAVDLATAPAALRVPIEARQARLLHLTELAVIAGLLHAAVLYGRGHFNVHLGDGIV